MQRGLAVLISCMMTLITAIGCGTAADAVDTGKGDMTTQAAVVHALEGTGYHITYRKVPRIEGFETVVGRARSAAGGIVEFGAVVRRSGPFPAGLTSIKEDEELPVIRYAEGSGDVVGNVLLWTSPQLPFVPGHVKHEGRVLVVSRGEYKMEVRIGLAIDRLFASKFVPVG
jgi:hypothetical protein